MPYSSVVTFESLKKTTAINWKLDYVFIEKYTATGCDSYLFVQRLKSN